MKHKYYTLLLALIFISITAHAKERKDYSSQELWLGRMEAIAVCKKEIMSVKKLERFYIEHPVWAVNGAFFKEKGPDQLYFELRALVDVNRHPTFDQDFIFKQFLCGVIVTYSHNDKLGDYRSGHIWRIDKDYRMFKFYSPGDEGYERGHFNGGYELDRHQRKEWQKYFNELVN